MYILHRLSLLRQPPSRACSRTIAYRPNDAGRYARAKLLACAWSLLLIATAEGVAAPRQPVYVGAQACAECHEGPAMGDQFTRWLHTRHSRAYLSLAQPEAEKIAKWSGITTDPQASATCLGCHATGAQAEPWQKDPTFALREGVQCEKCHGPGSEYMDAQVMMDRQAAVLAGLNLPTLDDCMNCHAEKGTHRLVLGPRSFDAQAAWAKIAHPTPDDGQFRKFELPELPPPAADEPELIGAAGCAECHTGADRGFQFSIWRGGPHAEAYASLGSPRGREIAVQWGVEGDPRASVACLKCHSTAYHAASHGRQETYSVFEGVNCEACHGAGSKYAVENIMRDPAAAQAAGLRKITPETCLSCHADAHGKPFDYEAAVTAIAHPLVAPQRTPEPQYKTPLNMALSPDSRECWVACEASHSVVVVDVAARRKIAEIPVGGHPMAIAFDPQGARAFVSNRLDDSVSVIDVAQRQLVATVAVGDEPHGLLTDREGKLLYVLNTSSDNISVIDVGSLEVVKTLAASRSPWALALSPDGSQIFATNALSRFIRLRTPSMSEVTVIDTQTAMVSDRIVLPGANLVQGVAAHPSGKFVLTTLLRTKNLVPMTRVHQGWTITNGLGVLWADGQVDQVLLDQPGLCFPDPADVAITPDGRVALVTSSTDDRVAIVDLARLTNLLENAGPDERKRVIPNHLGKSAEFLLGYVATRHSPRGVLVLPDSRTALTANALDDSLTMIDIPELKAIARIDLGGPREITQVRWGEQLFHSAAITFRHQFSCHSCHPDGHIDNVTYDIEPDGIGVNPVDNRTLRGILDTAPFKWSGKNPSFSRQCGARLSAFFTRGLPFTPEQVAALDLYICTIPRPPNRHRPLGAPLTEAQRQGKALFERTIGKDGQVIPKNLRCVTCHFPPLYTDRRMHNVGTSAPGDTEDTFDTPHLNNIYDSAPYLHNGMASTLEEIWTVYNPNDQHGLTNDMTKDELNALIEYLKTL